ncbi:MAG: hypothetical protein WB819_16320 [Terriglobia bacterium]|jgi:hypothetical protein
MEKHLLIPSRVRRVPRQFSWVDQRLVREHYLERCDRAALALYLLLVTVADARGLSFYADRSIERLLGFAPGELAEARAVLIRVGLLAFEAPLYQVLSLEVAPPVPAGACAAPKAPPRSPEHAAAALRRMRAALGRHAEDGPP